MPEGLQAVPDWFPWENQGAGVAVADLGGQQHLVVLMVDDAPGQNRGLYRIGRNLDAAGQVTGLRGSVRAHANRAIFRRGLRW
jgi:hypothetical protein